MKRNAPATTEASQNFTFTRRAIFLGGAQAAVGGLLALRMGWLSIFEQQKYALAAESNRVALRLISPRRGWIVDRYGRPLAMNRPDFRVDMIPDQTHDVAHVLARLKRVLGLTSEDLDRIRAEIAAKPGYRTVAIAEDLDWNQYAALNVNLPDLPGVQPLRAYARSYPQGPAVAHLLGYVGAPTPKQYQETRDPLLVLPGFKVGKDGLEKTLEDRLRGRPGARREEVNARGRVLRELDTKSDVPGHTIQLTIDGRLQDYASRRLGNESGSVVVLDCLTGDILTIASMPAYDPNSFSQGIGRSEWARLRADDHLPLLNKSLQGLYPPGSTFKPASALAFLEGGLSANAGINCSGGYDFGGRRFHCWKRGGHGHVTLGKAIYQSCDTYFYHFGHVLGIDRIAAMAKRLGLGQKYDLPVPSQRFGTVPDTAWKLKRYKKAWLPGETLSASIGQGYTLANPMQLAVMSARLATGMQVTPRLLKGNDTPRPTSMGIDPEHLQLIRQGMSDVVNGPGTAGRSRLQIPGVQMAGKTGTAQVRSISMAERRRGVIGNESLAWRLRDHALFVAFTPVENPRYATAVVIEHGGGGSAVAAPIARDVLTYLMDPARAMKTLTALEEAWGGDLLTRTARLSEQTVQPSAPSPTAAAPAPAEDQD